MKDISNLGVTQIRVFGQDVIPFARLQAEGARQRIQKAFGFKPAEQPWPIPPGITLPIELGGGSLKRGRTEIVIEALVIEPRRILTRILGTSEDSAFFYSRLSSLIQAVDTSFRGKKPVVEISETSCTAALDIDFNSLFSDRMAEFLALLAREAATKQAKATAAPFRFRARIGYEIEDGQLAAHDVKLLPKELGIERRVDTPPESNKYFTQSPLDSDSHLRILRELERIFPRKG